MNSKSQPQFTPFPPHIWVPTSVQPICDDPNCCTPTAPGTCSPRERRLRYVSAKPTRWDLARRKYMEQWLKGRCTLHEAVMAFQEEWDGYGEYELQEAA